MATIFVSQSGNDFNPGISELPKRTITAALSGAQNGDTIIVKAGVYKETATYRAASYSVTVSGMGHVVINGEGIRASCLTLQGATSANNRWVGVHFRNATTRLITMGSASNYIKFEYCEFSDAPQVCEQGLFDLYNCITRDLTSLTLPAWINNVNNALGSQIFDCTFENIPSISGCIQYTSSNNTTAYRNIFSRCACFIFWSIATSIATTMDFNVYDFGFPGKFARGGAPAGVIPSLAGWQALNSQSDPHSISAAPQFNDREKYLLSPLPGGNLTNLAPGGGVVGALRTSYALSNNQNATQWTSGASGINTAVNASGNWMLTLSPTGTVTFPVVDLGAVLRIRAIRLSMLGENYPTDVADVDNTDTNPNELQVEYRTSAITAFNVSQQPWLRTARQIGGAINIPNTQARWVQVRVMLRTDGVAA